MAEWSDSPSPLVALLGPTNTGKTHRAVERMLEHRTGMIGLPLRLLAREVYDRVSTVVGERAVALVTGEEKRIPSRPRYWVSTTEAMPVNRDVDYVAVDEVQLGAHPERGHVFTDRLLHARGRLETWLMGANTVRPLVERLLPTARVESHPRLSTLRYAGPCSLARLPPRSAVVTFSAQEVYALAARICRKKGGAAVVLGALSPHTRNAQVALYQAGEVDYLVATDAIGMGLNLQVDHVAFGAVNKFDGKELRPLGTAELAQIAGRAGRHASDGTFGTLDPLGPLPAAVVQALEQHRFPAERQLHWRNRELDLSSLDALGSSLGRRPPRPELRLVERPVDAEALDYLGRRPEIRARARSAAEIGLLWEVCQIPDFGHYLVPHHAELLREVFLALTSGRGCLDADWMARRVSRLDQVDGDLDALLMRIESIRTFTYISHHARWVENAVEWQARTQAVEERLSEALHQRLVERFVERGRVSSLSGRVVPPRPGDRGRGLASLAAWYERAPDARGSTEWGVELGEAEHTDITLDPTGTVGWHGQAVARWTRGTDLIHPQIKLIGSVPMGAGTRLRCERRLVAWTRDVVAELMGPLRNSDPGELSAAARGLVYQLEQGLGTVSSRAARAELALLRPEDRRALRRLGVRLGPSSVYASHTLAERSLVVRQALAAVFWGRPSPLPADAPSSLLANPEVPREYYLALGRLVLGPRAIRVDLVERIELRLCQLERQSRSPRPTELGRWLGCSARELPVVMRALGYRQRPDGSFGRARPRRRRKRSSAAMAKGSAEAGAGRES
jgi:ATP-dependent RNA helicase SUPV3L1/SUV3